MADISLSGKLPAARISDAHHRSPHVTWVLDQLPSDECIRWPGRHDRQDYGIICSKISKLAHRYIWILLNGTPPDSLPELDHVHGRGCRFRDCCNPAHLEPVTAAENARRRVAATPACPNDHRYSDDNIYWFRGKRLCRTCRRNADRRRPSGGARETIKRRASGGT